MTPARGALLAACLAACAHGPAPTAPRPRPAVEGVRLAAVMWPTARSIIYCARRIDDAAQPTGVAGPCARLEAGEAGPTKVLSWATLGRFDRSPPTAVPQSWARCRLALTRAGDATTLAWVGPTQREVLDEWRPGADSEADAFSIEATFAPEGEWMAVLRVGIGLGDGERVVQIAGAKLLRVPACE